MLHQPSWINSKTQSSALELRFAPPRHGKAPTTADAADYSVTRPRFRTGVLSYARYLRSHFLG
ncbi:hypothetical protein F2Q68_00040078 [Brassica cretica]|uniref:Uncharacterized protein n=1 Tax=Brassica cretica TaxID=69181 RepID=A0A8S9MID5_BRACR|nr:hypothetical protein F2Q68_00040078 [Brassica cretica]